ncbi:dephospho-CoA kinase [Rhodospirillales bacterium]|nr:dephospho-CoA kinase [Rhodospirillales bacterium]
MFILGLTGSIGMGKTSAAAVFRRQKVSVFDADSVVRQLLERNGEAVKMVGEAFKGVVIDRQVNRNKLGEIVFGDAGALSTLEEIIHPLVRNKQVKFLRSVANRRQSLAVLDIPLLFETGGEINCDAVAVVTAPKFLQKIRVMGRGDMTETKFRGIIKRQMQDQEKRNRADFIIPSGLGKRISFQSIQKIIRIVLTLPGSHWPPGR